MIARLLRMAVIACPLVVPGCTDDPSRSQLYSISGRVIAFVEGREANGDFTDFFLVEEPTGVLVLLEQAGVPIDSMLTDAGEFRFSYRPDGDYQVLVREMDTIAVTLQGANATLPDTLEVGPSGTMIASPNPFDTDVVFTATLSAGLARLQIQTPGGAVVRALVDDTFTAGEREFAWDAKDDDGQLVTPGIYLAVLGQAGGSQTQVLARCVVPTCLGTHAARASLDVFSRP